MSNPDSKRDCSSCDTFMSSNHNVVIGDGILQNFNHLRISDCISNRLSADDELRSNESERTDFSPDICLDVQDSFCSEQDEFGDFCFTPISTPNVLFCRGGDSSQELTDKIPEVNVDVTAVSCEAGLEDAALGASDVCESCDTERRAVCLNSSILTTGCSVQNGFESFNGNFISKSTFYSDDKAIAKLNGFCVTNQHRALPSREICQHSEKESKLPSINVNAPLVRNENTKEFCEARHLVRNGTLNPSLSSERLTNDDNSDEFDDFKEAVVERFSVLNEIVHSSHEAHCSGDCSNWAVFEDNATSASFQDEFNDPGVNNFNVDGVDPATGFCLTEVVSSRDSSSSTKQNVACADVVVRRLRECFGQQTDHCLSEIESSESKLCFDSVVEHQVPVQQLLSTHISRDAVWNGMNVIENTAALKHHWAGSHAQTLVMRALSINPSNILTKAKTTGATISPRGK